MAHFTFLFFFCFLKLTDFVVVVFFSELNSALGLTKNIVVSSDATNPCQKAQTKKFFMRDLDKKCVNGPFCWIHLISRRTIWLGNKPKLTLHVIF